MTFTKVNLVPKCVNHMINVVCVWHREWYWKCILTISITVRNTSFSCLLTAELQQCVSKTGSTCSNKISGKSTIQRDWLKVLTLFKKADCTISKNTYLNKTFKKLTAILGGPEWITWFQDTRIKATDRDQGCISLQGAVSSGSLQLISSAVCLRTAKEKVVRTD